MHLRLFNPPRHMFFHSNFHAKYRQIIILLKKFEIFLTRATTNTRLVDEIIMLPPDRIQFFPRTKCGSVRVDDGIIVCDELIIKFQIILYRFDIFNHLETSIDSFFSWLCINKVSNHADTHKICVTSNATNTWLGDRRRRSQR